MVVERYNVQTIAEVLLTELNKVEKLGNQIKESSNKINSSVESLKACELRVDTNSMNTFVSNLKHSINEEQMKLDKKIKQNRLSYFPIYLAIVFFLFGLLGGIGIYYGIEQGIENSLLQTENEQLWTYKDFAEQHPKLFQKYVDKNQLKQ
jgi:hypothetical protein